MKTIRHPNTACDVCGSPIYRRPYQLAAQGTVICSTTDCRRASMQRRWQDPGFRARQRLGRWGTAPVRTHEEIKRYMRDKALVRKFGITRERFNEILELQGGVCAVCGRTCPTGNALAVDHEHLTGRVRGLLCTKCNRGIGCLDDDPQILRRALDYLEHAEYLPL